MAIANPEVEFHLPEFVDECVAMLNELGINILEILL